MNDTNYSAATPGYPAFKSAAVLPNDVRMMPPKGPPRVFVADLPNCPNGIAIGPDGKTPYVSVMPLMGNDPFAAASINVLYAYDLVNISGGTFAKNQRVFAKADHGCFDGFTHDDQNNVFATMGDGVAVFNPTGVMTGKIILPAQHPTGNLPANEVSSAGNRLIIMPSVNVFMITLNTTSTYRSNGS